jgi:hypothetical protein
VVLHWPDFLGDYETARDKYWEQFSCGGQLMTNARERLERRPLMTVEKIEVGVDDEGKRETQRAECGRLSQPPPEVRSR